MLPHHPAHCYHPAINGVDLPVKFAQPWAVMRTKPDPTIPCGHDGVDAWLQTTRAHHTPLRPTGIADKQKRRTRDGSQITF